MTSSSNQSTSAKELQARHHQSEGYRKCLQKLCSQIWRLWKNFHLLYLLSQQIVLSSLLSLPGRARDRHLWDLLSLLPSSWLLGLTADDRGPHLLERCFTHWSSGRECPPPNPQPLLWPAPSMLFNRTFVLRQSDWRFGGISWWQAHLWTRRAWPPPSHGLLAFHLHLYMPT